MSSALILKDIAFSFNSSIMPPACKEHPARVAQGIEHWIPNPGVARSIRAVGTKSQKVINKQKQLVNPFLFCPLGILFS